MTTNQIVVSDRFPSPIFDLTTGSAVAARALASRYLAQSGGEHAMAASRQAAIDLLRAKCPELRRARVVSK